MRYERVKTYRYMSHSAPTSSKDALDSGRIWGNVHSFARNHTACEVIGTVS